MKMIRLNSVLALLFCLAWASQSVNGQEKQQDAKIEAEQRAIACGPNGAAGPATRPVTCHATGCNGDLCEHGCNRHDCSHAACRMTRQGVRQIGWAKCPVGKCKDGSCEVCRQFCPRHGQDCKHGCLTNQYGLSNYYGYGPMEVCPGKTNGICPVHGYAACPHQRQPIGPMLRQAFAPADRPYFADRPLYVPREQYDPNFRPRFPMVRAMFLTPPPVQQYTSTVPVEPMPTYTTRSPRDFLHPNPPSIGY